MVRGQYSHGLPSTVTSPMTCARPFCHGTMRKVFGSGMICSLFSVWVGAGCTCFALANVVSVCDANVVPTIRYAQVLFSPVPTVSPTRYRPHGALFSDIRNQVFLLAVV